MLPRHSFWAAQPKGQGLLGWLAARGRCAACAMCGSCWRAVLDTTAGRIPAVCGLQGEAAAPVHQGHVCMVCVLCVAGLLEGVWVVKTSTERLWLAYDGGGECSRSHLVCLIPAHMQLGGGPAY
jgi:hypothetical protein